MMGDPKTHVEKISQIFDGEINILKSFTEYSEDDKVQHLDRTIAMQDIYLKAALADELHILNQNLARYFSEQRRRKL